jgi:carnitine O-palmitoyltransferase 1
MPFLLDRIIHYSDSHHIAVYHKGRWYKVFMFYKDNLLQPCELQLYVGFVVFFLF